MNGLISVLAQRVLERLKEGVWTSDLESREIANVLNDAIYDFYAVSCDWENVFWAVRKIVHSGAPIDPDKIPIRCPDLPFCPYTVN